MIQYGGYTTTNLNDNRSALSYYVNVLVKQGGKTLLETFESKHKLRFLIFMSWELNDSRVLPLSLHFQQLWCMYQALWAMVTNYSLWV